MVRARSAVLGVAALCGLCIPATSVRANPDKRAQADALVREANKLVASKQPRAAIAKLKRAEKVFPRAMHDCNIGAVYESIAAWPQALRFLTSCRDRWPKSGPKSLPAWFKLPNRIQRVTTQLRQAGFVEVRFTSVPTAASVWVSAYPRDEAITTPGVVWLAGGTHVVHATRPGYEAYEKSVSVPGVGAGLVIEMTKTPVRAPAPPVAAKPVVEPTRSPDVSPGEATASPVVPPPAEGPRRSTTSAKVVTAIGAALVVNGAVFHAVALGTKSDANELRRDGEQFKGELDAFRKQKYTALVSYGVGAVVSAVGGYLWYRAKRDKSGSRVQVGANRARGGGVVWVRWDR